MKPQELRRSHEPQAKSRNPTTLSHRPLSSSFLGLPYRILDMNHKKELLRGLWVSHELGIRSEVVEGRRGSRCELVSCYVLKWDLGP